MESTFNYNNRNWKHFILNPMKHNEQTLEQCNYLQLRSAVSSIIENNRPKTAMHWIYSISENSKVYVTVVHQLKNST